MGRRGPPPTPTAILKSRGSWRANERPKEPIIPADKIEPPEWLSQEALEYWHDIEKLLKPAGVLTNADMPALAMLVDAITRYLKYRNLFKEKFDNNPVMVVDDKLVENPLVRQVDNAHKTVVRMFKEFGMTPSSRAGIEVQPPVIIQNSQVVIDQKDKSRFFPA